MFCPHCGVARVFHRRRVRHPLHFVLSLATVGFWLPVWGVLMVLQPLKHWACDVCGTVAPPPGSKPG